MSTHDEHRWALVYYHTTGPAEIGVVGPFGIREKAEDFQREHGPRLSMLMRWDHIPEGNTVYRVTPNKYLARM